MSRCLVSWAAGALAVGALGCGSSVLPGLSNAPRLGGSTTADDRIHDVVANGDDACGVHGEGGALRSRIPPCPGESPPAATAAAEPAVAGSLVRPWVNHFYVGWPCAPSRAPSQSMRSIAWTPATPEPASCAR